MEAATPGGRFGIPILEAEVAETFPDRAFVVVVRPPRPAEVAPGAAEPGADEDSVVDDEYLS